MVRVATDNLGTTEPSSSTAPHRFSPVADADGSVVPVLYAGDSLGCALGETVFHDLSDDPAIPESVFRADLWALRAGFITVKRELSLVDLTDVALAGLRFSRNDVINTPPDDYPVTATWAQASWDTTDCAGLLWNSRRSPGQLAYMLFVDPKTDPHKAADRRADLEIDRPPLPLFDGHGLGEVLTAATNRNVTVVF